MQKIIIAGGIVLLGVGGVFTANSIASGIAKEEANRWFEQNTNVTEADYDDLSVNLFTDTITVDGLRIVGPDATVEMAQLSLTGFDTNTITEYSSVSLTGLHIPEIDQLFANHPDAKKFSSLLQNGQLLMDLYYEGEYQNEELKFVSNLSIGDMVSLDFSAGMIASEEALLSQDLAQMLDVAYSGFSFELSAEKFVESVFIETAQEASTTAEAYKMALAGQLDVVAAQYSQALNIPDAQAYVVAVKGFLLEGAPLKISAVPQSPITLLELSTMSSGPQAVELLQRLNLKVEN